MHMKGDAYLLKNTRSIQGHPLVCIPGGKSIHAIRIGETCIAGKICLNDVLLVPIFNCNPISAAKLIDDINCRVIFLQNICLIQDRTSGKSIVVDEL